MYKLLFFLILSLMNTTFSADRVTFYIQAHQDDWQLFTGHKVWDDVRRENKKVVFIYTTAGQKIPPHLADQQIPPVPHWSDNEGFFRSRERAALTSVYRILHEIDENHPYPDANYWHSENIQIGNKNVVCYVFHNTESYFMRLPDSLLNRLPDGSLDENGNNKVPLTIFGQQNNNDNANTYDNITEFDTVLRQIIQRARNNDALPIDCINVSIPYSLVDTRACREDGNIYRIDHGDHDTTSRAVLRLFPLVPKILYHTYPLSNGDWFHGDSTLVGYVLGLRNIQKKISVYEAYSAICLDNSHRYSNWLEKYGGYRIRMRMREILGE